MNNQEEGVWSVKNSLRCVLLSSYQQYIGVIFGRGRILSSALLPSVSRLSLVAQTSAPLPGPNPTLAGIISRLLLLP